VNEILGYWYSDLPMDFHYGLPKTRPLKVSSELWTGIYATGISSPSDQNPSIFALDCVITIEMLNHCSSMNFGRVV